jgi:hypothetical protein
MDASISATLFVTGIKFKLAKDSDEHPYPIAEIVLVTSDLKAASELAWHLGQQVYVDIQPQQPRLDTPLERAIERSNGR